MSTKKTTKAAPKSEKTKTAPKPKGCRLCRYRVAPQKQNGERVPCCCFGYQINDERKPTECGELFAETDYYIKHPEEP